MIQLLVYTKGDENIYKLLKHFVLPLQGPQPDKIVCEHFACLLGNVWWFPAQRWVDGHQVALCCWGLGRTRLSR